MTREEIEALVAYRRPGWRVVVVTEIDDEGGPGFEVTVERGDRRKVLLVDRAKRLVEAAGGRRAEGDRRR